MCISRIVRPASSPHPHGSDTVREFVASASVTLVPGFPLFSALRGEHVAQQRDADAVVLAANATFDALLFQ